MKASDLMIGDWVQVPSELSRYKRIRNTFDMDKAVFYKPIPLTTDILEKNGFIKESRENHGNILQYCILTDGLWIDISGENYFEGKLEYIHQLQHALILCRIEKEIIL